MDDTEPSVLRLHHVALPMPAGAAAACRTFYSDVLGMEEVDRPSTLGVDGCWFRAGSAELHLSAYDDRPHPQAHPGLLVADLEALADRLVGAGRPVRWDDGFPGHRRFYTTDPFGNRLELLQPVAGSR